MIKKVKYLIVLFLVFITTPVYAANEVEYNLNITDDYKFIETINYKLTDYEQIKGGNNPFAKIVSDEDIMVDILGKTYYTKTKKLENGIYYVTLTHTYSEYGLSNSILLNDCFEKSDYNYNADTYTFKGTNGFYCNKGESLKITLTTNFEVTSTNATVSGNNYIWTPQNNNFTMNISINKNKDKQNNQENNTTPDNPSTPEPDNEKKQINKNLISILIVISLGAILVIATALKMKSNRVNDI